LDLLVNQVSGPQTDAVIVNGDQLGIRGVVELNLVGGVRANWISTESLPAGYLQFKLEI
jgi:hypothetical protein